MKATAARRRVWVASLIALLTVTVCTAGVASPSAAEAIDANCVKQGARNSPTTGLVREAHPVVLVHGWDGAPMSATRALLEKEARSGWQFLLFDYSAVHDHWAARPEIAACLAAYIDKVSLAHRDAHGDGKVFLVAHSMGGLAVSYAANESYGRVQGLSDRIGGLITIDTPWTGSPWGGSAYAKLVQAISKLNWPGPSSDAWTCLRKVAPGGSDGCSTPAYLPRTVPVTQIAGDITLRRTYFGLHAYDISLGSDTIVRDDSQHGYIGHASGSPLGLHATTTTVSCTHTLNAVLAEGGARLGSRGGWVGALIGGLTGTELQLLADGRAMDALGSDKASPALIVLLLQALVVSPCSHIGMPTNPDTIRQIVIALHAQAAPQQLVPTDLLNAPIPASCRHSAGRLAAGSLPIPRPSNGPDPGFATVLGPSNTRKFLVRPVIADLTRDVTPELSGVLLCSAGGVSWPELVLVYSTGPKLLGYVDLGDVTPAEHSDVNSMVASGSDLRLSWQSYEGCCFQMEKHTGTLHWDGTRLRMLSVT